MTPDSYRHQPCDLCGEGSRAWCEVKLAFGDDDLEYTQTRLCRECFEERGFAPALEHNEELKDA